MAKEKIEEKQEEQQEIPVKPDYERIHIENNLMLKEILKMAKEE